jgi:phage shock protein PspC (stress-responsive transcriptional regulator)
MDDMNATTDQPGHTDPGSNQQQTLPPLHQDLDRLRRSVSDRYVAGVAGGLGRHFNVDPTVVRVLLAVLTLFGGAGVLIYAVCWAFVPEDGKDRATIKIGSDARKILLLAAGAVAFLLAMGDAFSGFNAGWPIASVAVVIGVVMIARDRRNERRHPSSSTPATPTAQASATPTAPYAGIVPSEATTSTAVLDETSTDDAPPSWQPPVLSPPLLPPHPKRTGILWFLPTVALIAIGLGIVGIIDSGSKVDAGVYPLVAVAITGVMLVVGSITGRPGGLILLGIISTFVLSATTVLGTFDFDGRTLDADPVTAAQVQSTYSVHLGRVRLDLTDVADPQNLVGRTIDLHVNAGEIVVTVPRNLNVHIDARMKVAGGIRIPGYDGGGVKDSVERSLRGVPATASAPLELDIHARVGQITVEYR